MYLDKDKKEIKTMCHEISWWRKMFIALLFLLSIFIVANIILAMNVGSKENEVDEIVSASSEADAIVAEANSEATAIINEAESQADIILK